MTAGSMSGQSDGILTTVSTSSVPAESAAR